MNGSSTAQFNRVCFGQPTAYTCGNDGQIIKLQTPITTRTEPAQAALEVGPNPARKTVKVRIPSEYGPGGIRIFTITGKTVLQNQYEVGEHAIDLGELPGGMYILQFRNADHQSSQRLLLQ